MTLLIFKTAQRTFVTSGWTAQSYGEGEIRINFVGEDDPAERRVFYSMSMDEFLAKKVGDTIDLRGPVTNGDKANG